MAVHILSLTLSLSPFASSLFIDPRGKATFWFVAISHCSVMRLEVNKNLKFANACLQCFSFFPGIFFVNFGCFITVSV